MGFDKVKFDSKAQTPSHLEASQPRIILVSESAEFQNKLSQALEGLGISVIAKLSGSSEILPALLKYSPQVVILDFFLKPHDALYMTEQIMREKPIPIILLLPSHYPISSEISQEAYRLGVSLLYPKPVTDLSLSWALPEIGETIFQLANTSKETLLSQYLKNRSGNYPFQTTLPAQKALGIVGSTGAVELLKEILLKLPKNFGAATLVCQHMSAPVWDGFKDFLSKSLPKPVAMAKGGEILREDAVILSPVQKTLMFERSYVGKIAILENARKFKPGQVPLQPNLDEFLISLAENFKRNAMAVILSGMGTDGAEGAKAILAQGGKVLVQDPKTAIIPSMPENALKNNPQAILCELIKIHEEIAQFSR